MKEVGQQSDIGEIIRRLRGGKEMPPETPLARASSVQRDLTPPLIPVSAAGSVGKTTSYREADSFREEKASQKNREEISLLEKELAALRKKESSLLSENDSLRKDLRSLSDKGSESFTAHIRLFEEKLLTLASEKETALKEALGSKTLLEEMQKKFEETSSVLKEKEEKLVQHEEMVQDLSKEKERLSLREQALLTQISLINDSLAEEKHHKEIIGLSVKTNQDHITELRSELEHLHEILKEKEERMTVLEQEKDKAEARVSEVEEVLVLKLASITELEEEVTSSGYRIEELEGKALSQEEEIRQLKEKGTQHEELLSQGREEADTLRGRLGRANQHIVELRSRIESLDRVKNMMTEATQHIHALSDLFGPTPQSIPSLRHLVESFVVKAAAKRTPVEVGEVREQELF